jgi:hypothetical protein
LLVVEKNFCKTNPLLSHACRLASASMTAKRIFC